MFSATDAAFSGFRAGREHFRTLLLWIPLLGLASLGMTALMVTLAGPQLMEIQAVGPQPDQDPKAALEAMRPLATLYLVLLPTLLIYYAVLYSAVNRMMLRPRDKAFAYFSLGGDELRQLALMVLQGLALMAVYIAGVIAVVVLAAVAGSINVGLAVLVGIFGGLAVVALMVLLLVRLSLASAQTFATRKVNVFGSWALTRGHFWPILGAYVLALVLTMIAYAAVFAILMLLMVILGGGFSALGALFAPDMTSLATLFTPTYLIYYVAAAVPMPFLMLLMLCPAPDIYRSLTTGTG
jgi:hypothetical protein